MSQKLELEVCEDLLALEGQLCYTMAFMNKSSITR